MMLKLNPTTTLVSLCSLAIVLAAKPVMAISGFTGVYDSTNFVFTPNPGGAGDTTNNLDTTNAATGTTILFGPDNAGDGANGLGNIAASVDWTIAITPERAGSISFDWSFDSFFNDGDDIGGYLFNGVFTTLASSNGGIQLGGPVNLTLTSGDTFGFRVSTSSNLGGEGILTISNFHATPVPLESDALPILLSVGFLGGGIWLKRQFRQAKG